MEEGIARPSLRVTGRDLAVGDGQPGLQLLFDLYFALSRSATSRQFVKVPVAQSRLRFLLDGLFAHLGELDRG